MKTSCCLISFLALWLAAAGSALAHPVSQGSLDLQVLPDKIQVNARVSAEEIFVADAFAADEKSKAASLDEVWRRHGEYLLQHLKVFADDRRLAGTLLNVGAAQQDFVVYQIEFAGATRPSRLRVEQDVLNEIEFAPGNPWEAAYVARVRQQGRPAQECLDRKSVV